MTDTFTWQVHANASGGGDLSVAEAKFGDGYSQEVAQGLNVDVQKWNITVSGVRADMEPVRDFIVDHAGISFYWTPPLGVQGLYRCRDYKPNNVGGLYYTISCQFYQVYAP